MLLKKNRLTKRRDFDTVYKNGRFVHGDLAYIKYWRIEPEAFPRRDYAKDQLKIAFVVGKKVDKTAVARNRVKRQLREVVRLMLKENKIKAGYLVVITAKASIVGVESSVITKEIKALLKRSRLLV